MVDENANAQRLGSLQIEDQLKPCRLNDRQVLGLFAFEDASGITAGLLDRVGDACPIGGRRTELQILATGKDRRQSIAHCELDEPSAMRIEERICRMQGSPPTRRAIMAAKARSSSSGKSWRRKARFFCPAPEPGFARRQSAGGSLNSGDLKGSQSSLPRAAVRAAAQGAFRSVRRYKKRLHTRHGRGRLVEALHKLELDRIVADCKHDGRCDAGSLDGQRRP